MASLKTKKRTKAFGLHPYEFCCYARDRFIGTRRVTVLITDESKNVLREYPNRGYSKDYVWGHIRIGDSPVYVNVPKTEQGFRRLPEGSLLKRRGEKCEIC